MFILHLNSVAFGVPYQVTKSSLENVSNMQSLQYWIQDKHHVALTLQKKADAPKYYNRQVCHAGFHYYVLFAGL